MATLEVVDRWSGPGARDAVIRPIPLHENGAHPSDAKGHFEHWYFDARLDDGHVIVGFLQTSELMTKKAGVELHVYEPNGTRHEVRKFYPHSAARAATDRCDVQVGHNWGRVVDSGALPVHQIFIAEDGLEFDLTFESLVPMWQPGEGRTTYGDDSYFAWLVAAPRAVVTGSIVVNGVRHQVTGTGYHDHNWGVGNMPRIVDHWYWGRVYAEDLTAIYATIFTTGRYGNAVSTPFMLANGGDIVLSTGEVEITEGERVYDEVADQSYPSSLTLMAGGVAELRLEVQEVIHAHDLLNDVPVVGKRFVKPVAKPIINRLLGNPGYFRFRSDYTLTAEIEGELVVRTGSTLHEAVALR
ncbi:MAG: hypothetical protein JHC95_19290 [Solirubrobacteraceae bacterium]|nr:hypothetical protein [Solirubrobacteraceae bacterium]